MLVYLRGASAERGSLERLLVVVVVLLGRSASFDDVEREATLQLHTGGAEDGAERACSASLLADYLADVGWGNVQAKDSSVLIGYNFHLDGISIIYQGPGDFSH
jgi:hypothetical protein